jgi:hypothetical protein
MVHPATWIGGDLEALYTTPPPKGLLSAVGRDPEHPLDFGEAHPVKISRHSNLSVHKAQPSSGAGTRLFQSHDLDHWRSRLSDDEGFAFRRTLHQARQMFTVFIG